MKGTVITRNNGKTWVYVIDVGRDENGKRLRKWSKGYPKKKDAQAAMRAELHRVESGGDPFPVDMTVGAFLERWLTHQSTRLRETTLTRYTGLLAHPEVRSLERLKLNRVRPAHIQDVMDQLSERFAPRSVIQARAVLNSAFRCAVAWSLIPTNPVQAVKPPKPERPKLSVPTAVQLKALLEAAKGTPWEIPMLLACTTGARRSEVLGLCWENVDQLHGRIRIVKGLQRTAKNTASTGFIDPKTSRAKRPIPLLPSVAARLRSHRQEQAERRLSLGPAWNDLDIVCDRGDGLPLHPDAFTHAFKRLAKQAGLPASTRLHDVRHGVATAMMESGVHPGVASAVLGHASPAFTLSVYSHVLDDLTDTAGDALNTALEL